LGYLIAADGANSIIRKWLGVSFDGFTYPEKFLTLSTEWPLQDHFSDLAYVNYMADRPEWCVLLRVPSMWRVLVPAQESDPDDWLLSDEKKELVFGGLVGPLFDKIASSLVDAFVKRAEQVYIAS
jgi:3-(3-hydroxy-phenyl)propionate hydroxylase